MPSLETWGALEVQLFWVLRSSTSDTQIHRNLPRRYTSVQAFWNYPLEQCPFISPLE